MALRHEYAPVSRFVARGTGKDREFAKSVPVFPCLSPAGLRYGAAPSAGHCPPAPARRGRDGVMRSARLSTRAQRAAMPQVGAPKQGTAPHRRSLWRWLAKTHLQLLGLRLIIQAQACATAVAPRRAGDDVIYLALHQSPQRGAFTLLLKRNAGMLLLASAADAKMGAARRAGAAGCRSVGVSPRRGRTVFIFHQRHLGLLVGQHAAHEQRLPLMAGNTLTKGIEVVDCNGYDLARRHTPFCRVELRHRRELSQSNKTSSFRAAAPRGAATLHRTMMSIFSHNGTA